MSTSAAASPLNASAPSKTKNILLWILQILVAALFLFAGGTKLASVPQAVAGFEPFAKYGIGQWFRYFTGVVEVVGAILLVIPRFVFIGGLVLTVVMIGAIITTLLFGINPAPPIIVLILTSTIAWFRRAPQRR
jgi:uncharacterized membrane protein YphA (DoxX/SURF4 family)